MKILVVGGAGYVGSHMVKHLCSAGVDVVVLDDLSSGFRDSVMESAKLVVGSVEHKDLLATLFSEHTFDAVMHFASFIRVDESVADPASYYANNVAATLILLDAMRAADVRTFIFSSTAAVYGSPVYVAIDERHPKNPLSPYGRGKWMVEQVLDDYDHAYGMKSVCLRYFNAAGADPEGEIGERHLPESHLIPLVLQAASGRRESISVYGTDYDTPDGTCIRDYIHVTDLCEAHALALDYLIAGGDSVHLNLGNGEGFSVKEVIYIARRLTGREFEVRYKMRRPGDPGRLVADSSKARKLLGWEPARSNLETIISDAWTWEQKFPWAPSV